MAPTEAVERNCMERILFVVPPHIGFEAFAHPLPNARVLHKRSGDFGSVLTDMPLGVLAMSSYVKKHVPVETRLLDFNIALNSMEDFPYQSFAEFFREVLSGENWANFNPGIIGITALFGPTYRSVIELADCCRNFFPRALVIAGGGVPTNLYRELLRDTPCLDALCYGEGEKPLLGLVQANDRQRHLEENPAWITSVKVKRGESFRHDFVEDLDEIPFYDYQICDIDAYGLNPAITSLASVEQKTKNFHVMTSRGCPHRCCFCSSHTVHGREMRFYSMDRVREDLLRLRDEYGAKIIVFQDDHLMASKQRALEIIEFVRKLGLCLVFQNGLALYALDRKTLESMQATGLDQLILSVESGSERILKDIMHKPLSLSVVKRVADDCRDLGIYTNVNVLIGLPGETKQDIEDARRFLRTINADWFLVFCATPLVGSEMMEICRDKGYLKSDYLDCDYKKAVVETEDFSAEYIQEMTYIMNLDLNFVHNSDVRLGDYRTALLGFMNAIRARDDHAFAHHYAALCHNKLGDGAAAARHRELAQKAGRDPFWRRYMDMFGLEF